MRTPRPWRPATRKPPRATPPAKNVLALLIFLALAAFLVGITILRVWPGGPVIP